jgi:hypothetical protein
VQRIPHLVRHLMCQVNSPQRVTFAQLFSSLLWGASKRGQRVFHGPHSKNPEIGNSFIF